MDKSYIIYKLTSPSGGVYIGQTSKTIEERGGKNGRYYVYRRKNGKEKQPLIGEAIIKYGWDNFKKEIIYENLSKREANKKEIETINYYKEKTECYNIANGGDGLLGVNEHKVKQYSLNGEFIKEWESIKSVEEFLGIKKAEANISACCQGRKKRAYGYIWKYSEDNSPVTPLMPYRTTIGQYDKEGNLIATFKSLREASQKLNINENGIGNVLHNRAKTCGGFIWKFV